MTAEQFRLSRPKLYRCLCAENPVITFNGRVFRPSRISVLKGNTHQAVLFYGLKYKCTIVVHSEINSSVTEMTGCFEMSADDVREWKCSLLNDCREIIPMLTDMMKGLTVDNLSEVLCSIRTYMNKPLYDFNSKRDFPVMLDVINGTETTIQLCKPKRYTEIPSSAEP